MEREKVDGLCSGKLSMEKRFANFAVKEPPTKVFSPRKFGHATPIYTISLAFCESF